MATETSTRPIPCEHCRVRRRKCVALEGTACERCREYGVVCLFRFPMRRTKRIRKRYSRRTTSDTKTARQVAHLQQQAAILEAHLKQLSSQALARHQRQLSLVMTRNGLRIETPIRSLTDMAQFLEQTWSYFFWNESLTLRSPPPPSPWPTADASMQVTQKRLGTEDRHVCILLTNHHQRTARLQQHGDDDRALLSIKHRMIDLFFCCSEYATPIVVRPYFVDLYHQHPDAMLSNATVAYVALTQCTHVASIAFPSTRHAFAQHCLERARQQLEDTLFGDDDDDNGATVENMLTLWLVGMCLIMQLKHNEARLFLELAWRTALQLRAVYLPLLLLRQHQQPGADALPLEVQAKAESWRRSYAMLRFVYRGFAAYDSKRIDDDDDDTWFHSQVGLPEMLPDECASPALCAVVDAFRHFVAFSMALPRLVFRLNTGQLERVSCHEVAEAQQWFLNFWHRLPSALRLSPTGPLDILDWERLRQCTNPTVLMLHRLFYSQWAMLEMRFIQPASASAVDGDRALMVVSVCCDAFVKLTTVLRERDAPCVSDVHFALIVAELLDMLRLSANPTVRVRAQQNFQSCCNLLRTNVVERPETRYFCEMGQLVKHYLQHLV